LAERVASVLESMISFHPINPGGIGSRIRAYAFGANLKKNNHWFVIQKAIEALMSFPYQDIYIFRIAKHFIKHENTMVRRAAVTLLTRAPKHEVRSLLRELTWHPDPDVLRLSQYLDRICSDREFSIKELAQIRKGKVQDNTIIRRLPQLYAASASDDNEIARNVLDTIEKLGKTKSSKVKFHFNDLSARAKWSFEPIKALPGVPQK
jgi:hypothetical protein